MQHDSIHEQFHIIPQITLLQTDSHPTNIELSNSSLLKQYCFSFLYYCISLYSYLTVGNTRVIQWKYWEFKYLTQVGITCLLAGYVRLQCKAVFNKQS